MRGIALESESEMECVCSDRVEVNRRLSESESEGEGSDMDNVFDNVAADFVFVSSCVLERDMDGFVFVEVALLLFESEKDCVSCCVRDNVSRWDFEWVSS